MGTSSRPLHFGVQLQAQTTTWADYAAAVQAVEELGFDSVWNFDHMLPVWGDIASPCFETLTTLAAMALLTKRARVGVLVNGVLYRDPATLAKAAAQVDQMSGGRFEFSLGAAWARREFDAYGLAFPSLAERYERLDEALQVVKLLWAEPRATFRGQFYQLNEAPCEPKPVQLPHPPIMVGGTGLGSLRIAARHANRLNLVGPPSKCAERLERFYGLCAESGRDPGEVELSVHPMTVVGPSAGEAEQLAHVVAASQGADSDAQRGWVVGDPEAVARRLRAYVEIGISHFVFPFGAPFDRAQLRLLKDEVVPALS
jgi:alkanesulfonate monooxygenase SsuD/methylene tetrahydromethanopterin reductase-like flavin-dependent oxidoreductase (luciferase family)